MTLPSPGETTGTGPILASGSLVGYGAWTPDPIPIKDLVLGPVVSFWNGFVNGVINGQPRALPGLLLSMVAAVGGPEGEEAGAAAGAADLMNISPKIARQMESRGCTTTQIAETVKNGKLFEVLNKATGGKAIEYFNEADGRFVVVDKATGKLIQVSGPGFRPNHLQP